MGKDFPADRTDEFAAFLKKEGVTLTADNARNFVAMDGFDGKRQLVLLAKTGTAELKTGFVEPFCTTRMEPSKLSLPTYEMGCKLVSLCMTNQYQGCGVPEPEKDELVMIPMTLVAPNMEQPMDTDLRTSPLVFRRRTNAGAPESVDNPDGGAIVGSDLMRTRIYVSKIGRWYEDGLSKGEWHWETGKHDAIIEDPTPKKLIILEVAGNLEVSMEDGQFVSKPGSPLNKVAYDQMAAAEKLTMPVDSKTAAVAMPPVELSAR